MIDKEEEKEIKLTLWESCLLIIAKEVVKKKQSKIYLKDVDKMVVAISKEETKEKGMPETCEIEMTSGMEVNMLSSEGVWIDVPAFAGRKSLKPETPIRIRNINEKRWLEFEIIKINDIDLENSIISAELNPLFEQE